MSRVLALRNRQRVRPVNTRLLRRIAAWALEEQLRATDYELGIHLVTAGEMAGVNETFLDHEGSTDVITFDYAEEKTMPARGGNSLSPARSGGEGALIERRRSKQRPSSPRPSPLSEGGEGDGPPAEVRARSERTLHGDIFISLDDAVAQARAFGTNWQSELVRYLLHGLLHLRGLDDRTAAQRRRMKREEGRLLRLAAREFSLSRLARR